MTEPTISIDAILAKLDAHFSPEVTGEWFVHDGNGRPHPADTYVEIEMRSGRCEQTVSAYLPWIWHSPYDNTTDIIRWRPRRQPLSYKELAETVPALMAHIRAMPPTV